MDPLRAAQLSQVLGCLQTWNVTISELLHAVLVHGFFSGASSPLYADLLANTETILSAFRAHAGTAQATRRWSHQFVAECCSEAVRELAHPRHGWHFSAAQARPEQIEDFRIEQMAAQIASSAPELWLLVRSLLGTSSRPKGSRKEDDVVMEDSEADGDDVDDKALWELVGDIPGEELVVVTGADAHRATKLGTKARRRLQELRESLADIKSVVMLSICMQHRDQRCNTLQSAFGIFLHSVNAPEKLVKVTAHMGLSISLTSIHRALQSLAMHSLNALRDLGQTLLTSYAFDNLEAESKALVPTVEGSRERLMHLTSGALLPLEHGVRVDDLRCSKLLWERSEHNPLASDPRPFNPRDTLHRMYVLHLEPAIRPGTLSRRGRFRKWFFLRTLCEHGPPYFKQFLASLRDPEPVEMIPVKKLRYLPCKVMDINQSKVSGNIDAIQNLWEQGGVGDPTREGSSDVEDISEIVTLIHGDLGTYERVLSALRQRKQEKTPYHRLQSTVFVIGLFHLKMAASDAIWRALVQPEKSRQDSTSFAKIAGKLRPDDSSHLVSNAKFRERHELIGDVGTVLRLDAWRVEMEKRGHYDSLSAWATAAQPGLAEIEEVAECLALKYVEGDGLNLHAMKSRSAAVRDPIQENTMRTHNYLFLYEELSYALNAGDIGRVETLLVPWVMLFRATGKHKYGTQTLRFMHVLHEICPEALRRAIRYNILVNPSGKPHHFRAVDWIIELLNLYIKDMYGGSGSNHTKARMIFESVLVLLFRSSHANFERNFQLGGLSFAHAQKDMRKTFMQLINWLQEEEQRPNSYVAGRRTTYSIPDLLVRGTEIIEGEAAAREAGQRATGEEDGGMADDADDAELTAEDISTEGMI